MASPHVRQRVVKGEGDRQPARSDRRMLTTFRVTHHALNVFLVVRGENGNAQMCSQMESLGNDRWALTLPLRPGRYRYRYYAIHERVTTYVSPKEVEERRVPMDGLDAILIVPDTRASHPGTNDESEERHDRPSH